MLAEGKTLNKLSQKDVAGGVYSSLEGISYPTVLTRQHPILLKLKLTMGFLIALLLFCVPGQPSTTIKVVLLNDYSYFFIIFVVDCYEVSQRRSA